MIIRVQKTANYVSINNEPLRDSSLSWAARGVLAYLLSQPDNWVANTDHLVSQGQGGRYQILGILRELEKAGYLHREKKRSAAGKWEWTNTIFETARKSPQSGFPTTDNRAIKEVPIKQEVLKRSPLPPTEQPSPPYQSDKFLQTLAEFELHRKQIRHPLTPLARQKLYEKLGRLGELVSIQQMNESIENGWQGVFEPKTNGFKSQAELNRGGRGNSVVI